jgi:hypothetical protein
MMEWKKGTALKKYFIVFPKIAKPSTPDMVKFLSWFKSFKYQMILFADVSDKSQVSNGIAPWRLWSQPLSEILG